MQPERGVKYYCPKCKKEQKVYPNPYYLHICDECGEKYDLRTLEMRVVNV